MLIFFLVSHRVQAVPTL